MKKSLAVSQKKAFLVSSAIHVAFAVLFILILAPHLVPSPGWLERTVSKALTTTYNQEIRVSAIRFEGVRRITLGRIEIRNEKDKPLIVIEKCTANIGKINFSPKFQMEICLHLKNVTLYRDYYKNTAREAGFWGSLMRKPLLIKNLGVKTVLKSRETLIEITGCDSEHVEVHGGMSLSRNGALHNSIETLLTPYMVLRAIF